MSPQSFWKTDNHSSFLVLQDREAEPRFSSGGQGGGMRGGFQGGMRGGFGGGYDAMGGGPGMMGGSRQIYVSNVRIAFLIATWPN